MEGQRVESRTSHGLRASFVPPVLVVALGVIIATSGARGSDWPAHLFRIDVFDRSGLTLWNGQWYGGHYTLGYSVLFPVVASWFGPLIVGFASSVAATTCFMLLLRMRYNRVGAWAACWVGVGMAVNLAVGRLPFSLGLALGLGALLAYAHRRVRIAIVLALLTPLASPVAGAFLAIVLVGVLVDMWIGARRGEHVHCRVVSAMCVAAVAPVAIAAVLFPDPGVFPFRFGAFAGVTAALVGFAIVVPRGDRMPRVVAAVAAAAAVPLFVIANPMGGNFTRFVVLFVAPVLAAAVWPQRRLLVVAGAVPLGLWMVLPGVAAFRGVAAPVSAPEYHRPVIELVAQASGPTGRVEIPFTDDHWEVAHIAPSLPIARGWERQVDIDRNAILYDDNLSVAQYRSWIDANAVRWVALPDVVLDEGGAAEATLIERGVPWLRLVRTTEHWRIWEVADYQPIVEPPGRLVSELPDEMVIAVEAPGSFVVSVPFMPYWSVEGIDACVIPTANDKVRVVAREPGVLVLRAQFSLEPVLGENACESAS